MKNTKQGITLISTLIVILILTILTGIITISINTVLTTTKLNEFEREYKLVKANTQDYIMRNSGIIDFEAIELDLATIEEVYRSQFEGETIVDNKIEMYVIDLEKIGVVSATYGVKMNEDQNDVYLVSKDTNNIYYKKGYEYNNIIYYKPIED